MPNAFSFMAIIVCVLFFFLMNILYLPYLEKKIIEFRKKTKKKIWDGWKVILLYGLNGLKSLFRIDLVPPKMNSVLFSIAFFFLLGIILGTLALIPYGPATNFYGMTKGKLPLWIMNLETGLFSIFTLLTLSALSLLFVGLSFSSSAGLTAGFRSALRILSLGIPMAFSLVSITVLAGSLNLSAIVVAQSKVWYLFTLVGPVACGIYFFVSAIAVNQVFSSFSSSSMLEHQPPEHRDRINPFNFSVLFRNAYLIVISLLIVLVFLGGWLPMQIPERSVLGAGINRGLAELPAVFWLLLKFYLVIIFSLGMRIIISRFDEHRLINISWKVLVPGSLFLLIFTVGMKQKGWL